jgi:heme exporter protein D
MEIQRKIEEIRRKPEHIRIRYVWGCVGVSMGVIVVLWLFSLRAAFQDIERRPLRESLEGLRQETRDTVTPSLGEWLGQARQALPQEQGSSASSLPK